MKEITARQQEIIAAALGIISERGLEALTIKNIADRVGFSDAAVYRHFQNKAQILSTIIDLFAGSSARLLEEINACDCSSLDKIKLFFLDRCRVFSADRVLATVMFAENLFQNDPRLAAKIHQVLQQPPPAAARNHPRRPAAKSDPRASRPSTCSPWSWARCACWSCSGGSAATASTCCAPGKNSGARWKH